MADYSLIRNEGTVDGLWVARLQGPNEDRDAQIETLLMLSGAMELLGRPYRIVPNTYDEKGGHFIMFGGTPAPGEETPTVAATERPGSARSSRPDHFLVLKEPPFPSSYDKNLYVERILRTLVPQYGDVEVTLLVTPLPGTSSALAAVVRDAFPRAIFDDSTTLTPFTDTHGGKGLLVWVREAAYAPVAPSSTTRRPTPVPTGPARSSSEERMSTGTSCIKCQARDETPYYSHTFVLARSGGIVGSDHSGTRYRLEDVRRVTLSLCSRCLLRSVRNDAFLITMACSFVPLAFLGAPLLAPKRPPMWFWCFAVTATAIVSAVVAFFWRRYVVDRREPERAVSRLCRQDQSTWESPWKLNPASRKVLGPREEMHDAALKIAKEEGKVVFTAAEWESL